MHARRDALVGGGPGWPGNVPIEIHNIESLERSSHRAFVAWLEKLGQELEERRKGASLAIIRKARR